MESPFGVDVPLASAKRKWPGAVPDALRKNDNVKRGILFDKSRNRERRSF
jgi:hypothetical protein